MEPSPPRDNFAPLPLADHNSDLQRRSIAALNACLPMDRFLVRDVRGSDDYGVDAVIELRDGRRVTNLLAQVQLKATDSTARIQGDIVPLQVKSANLNYLTNGLHGGCALYVLYLAAADELRLAWAADERARIESESRDWERQGTVTLKFGPRTLSTPTVLDEIYERILSHNFSYRSLDAAAIGHKDAPPQRFQNDGDDGEEDEDGGLIDSDPDRLVDAGHRIGAIRKDLGLDLPQFARALSHPDQRALARIESGTDQSPMWLVRRVAELSGARAGWIELGTAAPFPYRGRRYPVRSIELRRAPEILAAILARNTSHLYLCLEPRSKQVVVLAEQAPHHWLTYDLCALDFWNWMGSRYQIPKVRAFLQGAMDVRATLVNYSSCYLTPIATARILAGEIHPRKVVLAAVQRARGKEHGGGRYWTEDFVDIYGEREGISDTEADHAKEYGEWFVIARELMREWNGAIHPFERLRETDAVDETADASIGGTQDAEVRPCPRQQEASHRLSTRDFPQADYGAPINLLPRHARPYPWWRWRFGRDSAERRSR